MGAVKLHLIPLLFIASSAVGLSVASPANADCNYSGGSTLCSSGGQVRGGSAPPPSSGFSPYPCVGDPLCTYYDTWDPNIYLGLPGVGIGGGPITPGRPGGGPGRPGGGIGGGGGIGPR